MKKAKIVIAVLQIPVTMAIHKYLILKLAKQGTKGKVQNFGDVS